MNYDPIISRKEGPITSDRQRKQRFPRPIKIVLGIAIFLALFYFFFPNMLSSVFTTIVRPLWMENTSELMKENDALKNQIAESDALSASADLLQKENDELKSLLGRPTSSHMILAEVLKKPPFSAYDTFILDIGADKNIVVGDRVYASGIIPIGEIATVKGNTSMVKLYSSAGEKYVVMIGDNNIQASAVGRGGGTFEASVPRDSKISIGDNVTIPSLSNSLLGKVGDILSEPSLPFSTVLFNQPVNIYELKWVEVDIATPKTS